VLASIAGVAEDASDRALSAAEFDALLRRRIATDAPDTDLTLLLASVGLVRVATRLTADYESAVHRRLGLTWAGYRLLFCLWVAGPLPSRLLAALMWATPSTASSVLNTVERQGLIRRERTERDRRVVIVDLTDAGRELVAEAFGRQHQRETAWLSSLPRADLEHLVGLLETLAALPNPGAPDRERHTEAEG